MHTSQLRLDERDEQPKLSFAPTDKTKEASMTEFLYYIIYIYILYINISLEQYIYIYTKYFNKEEYFIEIFIDLKKFFLGFRILFFIYIVSIQILEFL